MPAVRPHVAYKNRILIVEDEPFIAVTLEDMLSDLGFCVAGCCSQLSQALHFIEHEKIDIALLDINIGFEKIDPVADLLAKRRCPFIFATGYDRSELPLAYADRAMLIKPYKIDDLERVLRAELKMPACSKNYCGASS